MKFRHHHHQLDQHIYLSTKMELFLHLFWTSYCKISTCQLLNGLKIHAYHPFIKLFNKPNLCYIFQVLIMDLAANIVLLWPLNYAPTLWVELKIYWLYPLPFLKECPWYKTKLHLMVKLQPQRNVEYLPIAITLRFTLIPEC